MMKMILILALAAGMIMLSGCTGSDSQAGSPAADGSYGAAPDGIGSGAQQQYAIGNGSAQGFGNRTGMMRNGSGMAGRGAGSLGNMTIAQRQQMAKAFAAACDGKAAGDACAVQNAFGARGEMNGTCSSRSGNLTCMPTGAGRRGWNRTGTQQPGGIGGQNGTGGFGQPPQAPQNP